MNDILSREGNVTTCPVAIIVRDNKILLGMRNYTPDKWKDISVWTAPGGRCDIGESLEATLRREVLEEVGINDLKIEDFIAELPGAKEGDVIPLFYCTTQQDPTLMEPEKFSEWKWVSLEDYFKGEPYNIMNPLAHKTICDYLKNLNE